MNHPRLPADLVSLCESEYPRLVGALSLHCGDPDVAEELAQETVAYAIRDWNRVRQKDSPSAWLHRVAMNLAHSYFRRRAAEKRAHSRLSTSAIRQPAQLGTEEAAAVREAVARLPHRQRQALVLRFFIDLPIAQVADLMECSEGTVKALTHQAISKLRKDEGLGLVREASDAI